MQDDPYAGYDDASSPLGEATSSGIIAPQGSLGKRQGTAGRLSTASRLGTAQRLGTAIGRGPLLGPPGTALGPPGTGLRSVTSGASAEAARPMTAVKGAGYTSAKGRGGSGGDATGGVHRARGPSEAEVCKQLEEAVHALIEQAAMCVQDGACREAHAKAQEAQAKAEDLARRYEANEWQDNAHSDLQLAARVCLAHAAHAAGLDQEALDIYGAVVRDAEYHMPGRFRANIGNIHFKNARWMDAVKQYRMALDQIPNDRQSRSGGAGPYASMQGRLLRNIGVAFLNQGMYGDARDQFEAALRVAPTPACAFNHLLCSYMVTTSVAQADALKGAFRELVRVVGHGRPEEERPADAPASEHERGAQRAAARYVVLAAKLVAPRVDAAGAEAGVHWCADEAARVGLPAAARDVAMARAAHCLAAGDTERAVEALRGFEKQSGAARTKAATNLSFLYLLEGNVDEAERYAVMAKEQDEYQTQALVNLGNCKFERAAAEEDEGRREALLDEARALYDAAARGEPDCLEAAYNLGLAAKAAGQHDAALEQFVLLNGLLPNQVEVLYQIADVYALKGDRKRAAKMLRLTLDFVGADPGALARLGTLHAEGGARDDALRCYAAAHEQLADMDVLALLCAQHVNDERYEVAAGHFAAAARLQPGEPKWLLMVASCHRRAQKLEAALDLYEQVHAKWPDNVEALRFLVQLCGDLQDQGRREAYEERLQKVERAHALREDVPQPPSRQAAADRAAMLHTLGAPAVTGTRVLGDEFGGGGELGLGGQALLPEALGAPQAAGVAPPAKGREIWDEELGADLLPGLD